MKQNTYHRQTAKLVATIAENTPDLSSRHMQIWIQNPKLLQQVLAQALGIESYKKLLPVMTITAAQRVTSSLSEFLSQCEKSKISVDDRLENEILPTHWDSFWDKDVDIAMELVEVSPWVLGFSHNVTYKEVCEEAFKLGLCYCPSNLVLRLRMNVDLPSEKELGAIWIATQPRKFGNQHYILIVARDQVNGPWLDKEYVSADTCVRLETRMLFRRKK